MKHTPTPWGAEDTYREGSRCAISANGRKIGFVNSWTPIREDKEFRLSEARANAAFIVLACNVHYELIAVLEGLIEYGRTGKNKDAVTAAIEVLNKAKGDYR